MRANSEQPSSVSNEKFLGILKDRFGNNMKRHDGMEWSVVLAKLESNPPILRTLKAMEDSGGEPDVVIFDKYSKEIFFVDCSVESPAGRRNLCYDQAALDARKTAKPEGSALEMAEAMGIELLTEDAYRALQNLGEFDLKTSSWVKTPPEIRKLGGALFCDRRYDHVFVYHNGASSYYGVRGFRGILRV